MQSDGKGITNYLLNRLQGHLYKTHLAFQVTFIPDDFSMLNMLHILSYSKPFTVHVLSQC